MKHRILLLSSVLTLSLAACGQEPISIEEKILMRSFAAINAAQAYDHVCQKDSLMKIKPSDAPMANISGNIQMLAYRIGWFMHERRPNDTADDAAKRLQQIQRLIAGKTEAALKKDGCEGEDGKAAKMSFDLYTKNEPIAVDAMINEEVIKNGGTLAFERVPVPSDKDQKQMNREGLANPEQLESLQAAKETAPPDDRYRAYPAWGEWVKNQLKFGGPLGAEEAAE